uniref:MBD domain-containing protein n=1 Tax=Oryza rufipogon TaxID=4529 RepID=A0A0E0P5P5_ORYRU
MGKSPSVAILDDDDRDEVKSSEEATKNLQSDDDDVDGRPGWLPDGWIMEVYCDDDGTIYRYYICPLSGTTFTTKSEVLDYLFSEMDQCFLESKNHAVGSNLTRTHEWLPKGWLVEIRAGGDNMDKMYKILAILEFNPEGLPQGWVKEVVFRKTNTGKIRRDRHYTDTIKNYVFRTKRSAALYVETGKVTIRAFVQKTSVHEVYSFEKFTHLHESLWKRLELGGTNQLRTRSSKLRKLSLKEEILSDEQGSTSEKLALVFALLAGLATTIYGHGAACVKQMCSTPRSPVGWTSKISLASVDCSSICVRSSIQAERSLPMRHLSLASQLVLLRFIGELRTEDCDSDNSDTAHGAGQNKVSHLASTTVKHPRGRPPKQGNARK